MSDQQPEWPEGLLEAHGIAAATLMAELMGLLVAKGVLTKQEGVDVIDGALAAVERADRQFPHPAFEQARSLLEASLAAFDAAHQGPTGGQG